MLHITDLSVEIEDKKIIDGFSIKVNPGEIHAIMGPNGSGKSTFAKVLAGHPSYEVTKGEISLDGKDLEELDPEERAHLGLFIGFQYPIEIPGVNNVKFLFHALNSKLKANNEKELSSEEFEVLLNKKMESVRINPSFKERSVNTGFSGGEKKRNEILQLLVLDPKFAVLDETDSGLDIDAMRIVADGINKYFSKDKGLILITHYQRLLEYVKPHFVHVMSGGKLIKSGGPELALELENKGYDWLIPSAKEGQV